MSRRPVNGGRDISRVAGITISSTHRSSPSRVAATSRWACRPRGSRSSEACRTRRMSCAAGASVSGFASVDPSTRAGCLRSVVAPPPTVDSSPRAGCRRSVVAPPPTDGAHSDKAGPLLVNERFLTAIRPQKGLGATPVSAACPDRRVRRGRRATCIVSARAAAPRPYCEVAGIASVRLAGCTCRSGVRPTSRYRSAGCRRR